MGAGIIMEQLSAPNTSAMSIEQIIHELGPQTDWGYGNIKVMSHENEYLVAYMLKPGQKSWSETWFDCIDWNSFYNPIADA